MLSMMAERDIPVVIGSDSHQPRRVSAQFEDALETLEEVGYRDVSFFHERQRQTLPIEVALASLV
jgi:histidinol-phosphatase (PHP family)